MAKRVQIQAIAVHSQAVRVDRATMWGNPFRADRPTPATIASGARSAAEAYALWLDGHPALADVEPERRTAILKGMGLLHGKDLACWCGEHAACHADVLLRRAAVAEPSIGDPLGRPDNVPRIALSVRQPWAWAIIYAGKDVENRSEAAVRNGGMRAQIGKRIAIHAAKGMTRNEYQSAVEFMASLGVGCPDADNLERGGIIGTAYFASVVDKHTSPWFCGPRALCLIHPEPLPFIGASGELGMFAWSPNFAHRVPPAMWMLPDAPRKQQISRAAVAEAELPLFGKT